MYIQPKPSHCIFYQYLVIFIVLVVIVLFVLLKVFQALWQKRDEVYRPNYAWGGELRNGNLDHQVHLTTGDEFEILANQFNDMTRQLGRLIQNNEEFTQLAHNAEIKKLQQQFNPHFTLNTLATLKYSLYLDEDISDDIITSLSRLLKYSIYGSEEFVT